MQLIDRRTEDGSRHFASLPKTCQWQALCEHISLLPGVQIANFVLAGATRAWLDFTFRGHRFSVSDGDGQFCLSVHDPQCPDLNVYQVASHCGKLLGSA